MQAWLLSGPGGVETFEKVERPTPSAAPGWVVLEVEAFGLNRSELFSRKGLSSPDFAFPRVLGLECAGRIVDPGDSDLAEGQRVVALMGGLGRSFDGGYATHVHAPRKHVFCAPDAPPAATLGAVPETYNTAVGVCLENLRLTGDEAVLVRGGTSALGMAAIEIAKALGCTVVATTRKAAKASLLRDRSRADHVVLDDADLPARVVEAAGRMQAVVECVGSKATIESSAATLSEGGRVGLVGQLAESWSDDGRPELPAGVQAEFTRSDLIEAPRDDARMKHLLEQVAGGRWAPNIHQVFDFDGLPEAHRVMEANEAVGKLVVVVKG